MLPIKIINQTDPSSPPVAFRELKDALIHWKEHSLNKHDDRHIIAYHDGSTSPVSLRVTKEDFKSIESSGSLAPRLRLKDVVTVKNLDPNEAYVITEIAINNSRLTFSITNLKTGQELRKRRKQLHLVKRGADNE